MPGLDKIYVFRSPRAAADHPSFWTYLTGCRYLAHLGDDDNPPHSYWTRPIARGWTARQCLRRARRYARREHRSRTRKYTAPVLIEPVERNPQP